MPRHPLFMACIAMAAILAACSAPEETQQSNVVPAGIDARLDLYRLVMAERLSRSLVKPAPSTDPDRQALVWGVIGGILSVSEMGPPPPSELMQQALEGDNLEVLQHVPGSHDPEALALALINADLAATDPHARYLPPVDVATLDSRLRLFDEGLGIEVVEDPPGQISVSGISQGSPASTLEGLQEGSVLRRMQAEDGAWYSPADAAQWRRALFGSAGSWAGLEWSDASGKTKRARIKRTLWSIESQRTKASLAQTPAGLLGLVSVPAFYDRGDGVGTLPDLELALQTLRREKANILVLDLRGNRGGEWRTVIDTASMVMPGSRLANALGPLDRPLPVDVPSRVGAWKGPVWVWVDQHTASGGEILAGALREAVGACIVGERTFGKATMQERIDIKPPSGGQALLTTVLYAWPSGKTAQWTGVEPDMWMSDPLGHVAAGERAYPSALVPFSRDVSTSAPVYPQPGHDDAAWISASLGTTQCKRR